MLCWGGPLVIDVEIEPSCQMNLHVTKKPHNHFYLKPNAEQIKKKMSSLDKKQPD